MTKRILSLLLAVLTVFSLCASTMASEKSSNKPVATELPDVTEETTEPETTDTPKNPPQPEETPKPEVEDKPDYSGLVTDAYTYQYEYDSYETWDYHVPQVNLDGTGIMALNAAMWSDLYDGYIFEAEHSIEQVGNPYTTSVRYKWYVFDDVLSILVKISYMADDVYTYYVYNMSLTRGERMSDHELFEAAGVTREEFNELLSDALYHSYDDSMDAGSQAAELRAKSTSDDNLARAMPYIGAGGALCSVAQRYAFAGADYYSGTYTLTPGEGEDDLTWFFERCDSQYLTWSDLEGFDKQMCVYAINGIYARSGRMFIDQDLQAYYNQFDWYEPTIPAEEFTDYMLNDYQIKNVALLLHYQEEQGF